MIGGCIRRLRKLLLRYLISNLCSLYDEEKKNAMTMKKMITGVEMPVWMNKQILPYCTTRSIWRPVRRICVLIFELKGLTLPSISQGLNRLVAIALLYLDEEESFW